MYPGKKVAFGQNWLDLGKSGCICAKMFYSGKVSYSGKRGCNRAKVVVFGQKWLYLGKAVVFGKKWLYSVNIVEFGKKWLYLGKVVVFVQKWLNSGKNGYIEQSCFILVKWFYSSISGCIRANVVVFGQKWLYSG